MTVQVLYKYRSLENWKFLIDILVGKRLYAASFKSLNDPMEGRYHYRGDEVSKAFIRSLQPSKEYWRICSLTTKPTSTLMWSYYGGGHTGVALGVKVQDQNEQRICPIRYDSEVLLGPGHQRRPPRDVALEILSQKQEAWAHEEEVRVFSAKPFVNIKLTRVLLGCQIAKVDEDLLMRLVQATAPRATIHKLSRSNLDAPLEVFSNAGPATTRAQIAGSNRR